MTLFDNTAPMSIELTNTAKNQLFEHSIDLLCVAGFDGYFKQLNPAWEKSLGFSSETLQSQPFIEFVHPDDRAATLAEAQKLAKGIEIIEFENRYCCKDGSYKWFSWNASPIPAQQVFCGVGREIRDRQRTQSATELRNNQQLLHSIIENTGACIFAKEYLHTNGTYLLVNRQFTALFNRDHEAIVGKTDYELFPASIADVLRANDRQAMEQAELVQLEEVIPQADGLHTTLVVKVPLFNSEGEIYGVCGIATDISERVRVENDRKKVEAALRHSERQLRQQTQQLEQTLQDLRHTQAQLVQTEKMSSLGQLVAGVAHEINNPVSFIYGNVNHADEYTQDLLRLIQLYQVCYPEPAPAIADEADAIDLDFLMADLPKLMASMKLGAERIQEIVLSLRTFSRMDEAEMKAVDIHAGIDSTLLILQNRLKKQPNQPTIKIIKDYGELPPVECYAGQLNQVFMNILSNAIDALIEGKQDQRIIRIRTEVTHTNHINISIADNGCGMPESAQKRIFDPFFTTKPIGKGTGLGLSISYQIITEKHKGTLQCISSSDNGTEFLVTIPIHQDQMVEEEAIADQTL